MKIIDQHRKDKLLNELELRFQPQAVVGYWACESDPDDGSRLEVLRLLNVPTDSLVAVNRAAYDAAYDLFAFDWNFLIDVRDKREVEHGGCYALEFKKVLAGKNRRHHRAGTHSRRPVMGDAHPWHPFHFDLSGGVVGYWHKSGGGLATFTTNEIVATPQHLTAESVATLWMPTRIDVDQFILFSTSVVICSASTTHGGRISNTLAANTHYSLAA